MPKPYYDDGQIEARCPIRWLGEDREIHRCTGPNTEGHLRLADGLWRVHEERSVEELERAERNMETLAHMLDETYTEVAPGVFVSPLEVSQ